MRHESRDKGTVARGRWQRLWSTAFLLLVAAAPIARAQTGSDVLAALDRTDQVISRADQVIAANPNQLALDYLDQARQFQARARSAFAAGLLADAFRLTDTARRRAFAAIELAQQAGSSDFLQFAIERTDAFLDRIAPFLSDCPNEQATRLFTTALDLQRHAKDALQQGRPRIALSQTTDARGRATRALRLAEASCGDSPDRAQRAVERTDQLLEDSAWLSDQGSKAARGYDGAMAAQQRAKHQLDQGRYPDALDLTLQARDQLVRALSRSDRPLGKDAVAQAVQASAERLQRSRVAVSAGTSDGAQRSALDQATQRQRHAEDLLARGQLASCLAEVHAVRTILERAGL
jgi:hypothetical protein